MKIDVNNQLLVTMAFVSNFVPKTDIRHYLTNLYMEFDGKTCHVVGTNGHYMTVGEVEYETDKKYTIMIPYDKIKPILEVGKKCKIVGDVVGHFEVDANDDRRINFVGINGDMVKFIRDSGTFVDWRKPIPKDDRPINITTKIGFNLEYLVTCQKAMKNAKAYLASSHNIYNLTTFQFGSSDKESVVVTYGDGCYSNLKTIIMPIYR